MPSYTLAAMLLCLYENSPVLSAPVNAWDTGKPFALSAPMALHILTSPEAIEIGVFFRMMSQFAMTKTKTKTSVSGEKKTVCASAGMPCRRRGDDPFVCSTLVSLLLHSQSGQPSSCQVKGTCVLYCVYTFM